MIQNILTFCVKNDLTFVDGSLPSGKLVANDLNRNSIYLITPYIDAVVMASFQSNLQSDAPISTFGTYVGDKVDVKDIVDEDATYFNLVKDWAIWEFKVPSKTLSFISRNRASNIGISFSIEQRILPNIKPSYGAFTEEITSPTQVLTLSAGYYIVKVAEYIHEKGLSSEKVLHYNDIAIGNPRIPPGVGMGLFVVPAIVFKGMTATISYSVDPSILNDNFEYVEPTLTQVIMASLGGLRQDVKSNGIIIGQHTLELTDHDNRIYNLEVFNDTLELNDFNDVNITSPLNKQVLVFNSVMGYWENVDTVEKALKDDLGNVIKSTYANKLDLAYSSSNNRIAITLKSYDGTTIDADLIDLPKATTSSDGLLAKEDKIKINAIASDVASAISTHDGSETSHLYIRTLINDLQKEVDRINAKGRSWGEVDKTFSELWEMAESTRSDYINTFLATAFSGYTPSDGDLVYTIVSDTEEEHELEYNSTSSQWVDNGAYIVGKASNTQMGIVKGDLNYVSILNGIIQVLKSDYATNVGSSGASYDYDDLLALFTEVANDIYNKSETYSRDEVDLLISNLSHYFNLQETAIEYSTGVYDFPNGATKPYTLFQDYNWVKFRFFNNVSGRARAYYTFIKPAMAASGNSTLIQIQRTPVRYARIRRTNGDIVFDIIDENNIVDTSVDYTMRCWGEELVQLTTGEITHKTTETIEHYLDNLDSDQVYFNSGLEDIENLVVNGDFSNGTTGWSVHSGVSFSVLDGNAYITMNGQYASVWNNTPNVNVGDIIYYYANIKSDSSLTNITLNNPFKVIPHPGDNQFHLLSGIYTKNAVANSIYFYQNKTSDWTEFIVDFVGEYNVSQMKLKGVKDDNGVLFSNLTNGEIKAQLDTWVQNGTLGKKTLREKLNEIDAEIEIINQGLIVDMILPPKLYGLVGKELNVYYDNIINYDYKKFDFAVVSTIGQQMQRRYRLTPSVAETKSVEIKVLDSNIEKISKTTSIVVKSSSVGNGITKKLLVIGDSTTADSVCITKLNENFSTDVMNIQTIGTKGVSPNNHEGLSGWTANMFVNTQSNAYGTNEFFNPSTETFDFSYYMSNSGVVEPDYVIINLGINDTFGFSTDTSLLAASTVILGHYQTMIDSIHSFNPNIKIGIALTIPPNYSQDAFGKGYGVYQKRDRYKRNNFLWVKELINYFKDKEANNIYLVPINTNLDTEYNMGFENENINARNTTQFSVPVGNGGVHPAESGYWQIADVYWYWLKSFES